MTIIRDPGIKHSFVTPAWRPSMMMKLSGTAEAKRAYAKFCKLRNYCERQGHSMRYMDAFANVEIAMLRNTNERLTRAINFLTSPELAAVLRPEVELGRP